MNKDMKKIVYSLHPLERSVLPFAHLISPDKIKEASGLEEEEISKGLLMLEQKGYLDCERVEKDFVVLDRFGEKYAASELPEFLLLKELKDGPKRLSEFRLEKEEISSAMGILKRNDLIDVKKEDELVLSMKPEAKDFMKSYKNPLKEFLGGKSKEELDTREKKVLEDFRMRKGFFKETKEKSLRAKMNKEGEKLARELEKYKDIVLVESIDSDMLKTGSWKGKEFRHYDIGIQAEIGDVGRRHPMIEANNILRDVFVEMGFKEMEGPMVETAFWNMDTMWIPQDHPARDEQDTFYLEGKGEVDSGLLSKVKQMHEKGIKKTHTMEGEWSEETSLRRLLRTHSTATTFRTLAELGKRLEKGEDVNGKYFYVANNFRNEAVDATHLAEFYQAEGFIIGDDLSLADLMGFIREYYAKLGIDKIKFKPTYNPYTEPSMEAHYYDAKMKKWYALINSGIFRAETLEPLGLKEKTIIAWGMGASRVATLLAGVSSMRDLTGATCDLEWLRNRPVMKREISR